MAGPSETLKAVSSPTPSPYAFAHRQRFFPQFHSVQMFFPREPNVIESEEKKIKFKHHQGVSMPLEKPFVYVFNF
jgi:hypothetical protein